MGLRFVPLPGQAAQVTRCMVSTHSPGGTVHLITSPIPAAWFPGCCSGSAFSGVSCVSSVELISGCDPPGRCQPSRISGSNWEPAHNLVEDAISGAEIAPCLLALAVTSLPLCLWWENGPVRRQLASSILCSMSVFLWESSLSLSLFFSLLGYPTIWVAISH